jgi:hypothetical protein
MSFARPLIVRTRHAGGTYEDFAVDEGDELGTEGFEYEEPPPDAEDWEYEEGLGLAGQYNVSPSQFVETAVRMPAHDQRGLVPFSFAQRRYLREVYDTPNHRILLFTGRQVEKSSTLTFRSLAFSCLIPHFKVLYVSPSSTQTKQFSRDRLSECLALSPDVKAFFPPHMTDNVFEKRAINRSAITLRYAYLNADRTRGLSSDMILMDEFQDLLMDSIPVIEETASHSPHKYYIYSGTPKSEDNPIEVYWSRNSTQNEWAVPCERHGFPGDPGTWHWNILEEANIGTNSLICDRCGKPIDPAHPMATWVRTGNPDERGAIYEGFRIPQLMVPWITHKDLLTKQRDYPRPRFMNEVLARSFDSGQRPLTKEDIVRNCSKEDIRMEAEAVKKLLNTELRGKAIYAGVDWGQDSTASYTVLVLGAYINERFTIFYARRFEGPEAEMRPQMTSIMRMIRQFNIRRTGTDYGGGIERNDELLREFGADRVVRFQYSNPKIKMRYEPGLGRYLVHKHEVLGAIFAAFKRGNVFRLPIWDHWKAPFANDMLATFAEYNERTRSMEYKKSPNATDDTLHAIVFCFLAAYIDHPRPDVFDPASEVAMAEDEDF